MSHLREENNLLGRAISHEWNIPPEMKALCITKLFDALKDPDITMRETKSIMNVLSKVDATSLQAVECERRVQETAAQLEELAAVREKE
jgi:hypothetical protein